MKRDLGDRVTLNDWDGDWPAQLKRGDYELALEVNRDGELEIEFDVASDYYHGSSRQVSTRIKVEHLVELLRANGYVVEKNAAGDGQ